LGGGLRRVYRRQFREEESMIFELFYVTFVTTFIALVVLGHVLLFSAIYKCLRDNFACWPMRQSENSAIGLAFADGREAGVGNGNSSD
jgi:hypothetical protein